MIHSGHDEPDALLAALHDLGDHVQGGDEVGLASRAEAAQPQQDAGSKRHRQSEQIFGVFVFGQEFQGGIMIAFIQAGFGQKLAHAGFFANVAGPVCQPFCQG